MRPESRADFVLGMSLTEVILLLMFAVMLVYAAEKEQGGGQDPSLTVAALKAERDELRAKIAEAQATIKRLQEERRKQELLLEELKRMVGAPSAGAQDILERIAFLKRGYPVCQKNNTLIEVQMRQGRLLFKIIESPPATMPGDAATPLVRGFETADPREIQPAIVRLFQYEKSSKCRFDYRLIYTTDTDYRMAREKFERYFYPEKIFREP